MPVIDPATLPPSKVGSDYPPAFNAPTNGRVNRDVAKAGGATDWVANHCIIPPGGWSSQRHWHAGEDELVVVLSGEGALVDDTGRTPVGPGTLAVFPKNDGNGHHFIAADDSELVILALGLPETSRAYYPDIDLIWDPERGDLHRDETPY